MPPNLIRPAQASCLNAHPVKVRRKDAIADIVLYVRKNLLGLDTGFVGNTKVTNDKSRS